MATETHLTLARHKEIGPIVHGLYDLLGALQVVASPAFPKRSQVMLAAARSQEGFSTIRCQLEELLIRENPHLDNSFMDVYYGGSRDTVLKPYYGGQLLGPRRKGKPGLSEEGHRVLAPIVNEIVGTVASIFSELNAVYSSDQLIAAGTKNARDGALKLHRALQAEAIDSYGDHVANLYIS